MLSFALQAKTHHQPKASKHPHSVTAKKAKAEHGTSIASWYNLRKKPMANGKRMKPTDLIAAHRTLPFGSKVRVVSLRTHKSVIVTIADRGPFVKGRKLDLSKRAAKAIGIDGIGRVRYETIKLASR